jgi:hypothetical protein
MPKPSKATVFEEYKLNDFLSVDYIVEQTSEYIRGVMDTFDPRINLWGQITVHEVRAIPDFYGSPLIMKYFTDSVVLHIVNIALHL